MLKARYLFKFKYSFLCFALIGLSSLKASHVNSIDGLNAAIKRFTKNLDQYYKVQAYERAQKAKVDQDNFNLPDDVSNLPDDASNLPDDFSNLPSDVSFVQSESFDISNLPCKPQSSLKKIMNKSVPPVSISLKTSLLLRLIENGERFDFNGYHGMHVGLMYNMLRYGKMSFEKDKRSSNQVYTAYGLLYSIKKITKKNKIIEEKKVTQARIITERTKYIDNVIFHIELANFKENKYNIKKAIGQKKYKNLKENCLKLDSLLLSKEKNTLWNHVFSWKCKKSSLFIDINCRVNAVPLINMIKIYGPYFKKEIEEVHNNRQDELLVFPCPNKSFFVTTNSSITGASMVYA